MGPDVLVISNPEDGHTEPVLREVRRTGLAVAEFWPEELGGSSRLALSPASRKPSTLWSTAHGDIDLGAVQSVWFRRPQALDPRPGADANELAFVRDQWQRTLEGLYALLQDRLWVSHPDRIRVADCKPRQLHMAACLGLDVPDTLVTNDPVKVRNFFENHDGKVVVKPIGQAWFVEPDGTESHILTNRLTRDQLPAVDDSTPMIIQEEVEKAYEVRVNVVGQRVLAIQIDSQASQVSSLDWRRYDTDRTAYRPYELPEVTARRCLALVKALGLEFAALDLIRSRAEGRYVLLEVNPNGQFLWAEDLSGVRVSMAVARLLAGRDPPLSHQSRRHPYAH